VKTRTLKLVTQYDAGRNEYTVFRHNLTPEDADQAVRELSARLFSLFANRPTRKTFCGRRR